MFEWPAVFLGGLMGSAHCVGMCGGIALTVGGGLRGADPSAAGGGNPDAVRRLPVIVPASRARRQILFGLGRVSTYAFLGAMAGNLGGRAAAINLPIGGAQQAMSVLAGVLMIGVGLTLAGVRLRPRSARAAAAGCSSGPTSRLERGAAVFAEAVRAPGALGPFVAGLATGFLPCGLVYAFLAQAAAGGRVAEGALLMTVFGLGTLPAMTVFGCGAGRLIGPMRARWRFAAAALVVAAGGVTIWRGWPKETGVCCHGGGASAAVDDAPDSDHDPVGTGD